MRDIPEAKLETYKTKQNKHIDSQKQIKSKSK